jgi:glycosyltransferase involved in cell wall biosynthesis
MEKEFPFVSIIVPCFNEERFISVCLDSMIDNDYPKERMEILAVDGQSRDKTLDILQKYAQNHSFLKIINNPKKITPAALNLGIKNSNGEIIIKMDAHSIYQKDYISKCVKYLLEWEKQGAQNVGGVLKPLPAQDTIMAKAIAISLSSGFGAGSSIFRTGTDKPVWADTAAFGCYRKETLIRLGLFDERMAQIEDFELNSRLRKAGGKILLAPDIVAYYYPSSYDSWSFFRHNFTDGFWTTYPIKFGFRSFSLRHLVPLVFVLSLFLSFAAGIFLFLPRILFDFIIISYILTNLIFSFKIALREGLKYFLIMPFVFAIRHIGYGLGSLWGLIRIKI